MWIWPLVDTLIKQFPFETHLLAHLLCSQLDGLGKFSSTSAAALAEQLHSDSRQPMDPHAAPDSHAYPPPSLAISLDRRPAAAAGFSTADTRAPWVGRRWFVVERVVVVEMMMTMIGTAGRSAHAAGVDADAAITSQRDAPRQTETRRERERELVSQEAITASFRSFFCSL